MCWWLVVGLKILLCIVLDSLFNKGVVFDDGCFII